MAWLERFLKEYPGTVVAVTHDRYFLDNVAGWILELDRGAGIPWEGNYSSWLEQKRKRLAQEEKTGERAPDARSSASSSGCAWRRARGRPRARRASRPTRRCWPRRAREKLENVEIYIPPGPRLGNVVIEAEHLRKGYGDNLLIEDLSFKLPPGGIVGVIGPNGAGKTTLFRMIIGQEKPDARHAAHRRDREARLRRPEPRRAAARQERVGGDLGRQGHRSSSASAR